MRTYRRGLGAHPHVCGEHSRATVAPGAVAWLPGSSPRMRGTPFRRDCFSSSGGLIPTYAGNTHIEASTGTHRRAHPHVCGEHSFMSMLPLARRGSSPRMRGTPDALRPVNHEHGLIPTYAGNTRKSLWRWMKARAHPHVCGEHTEFSPSESACKGSSPRMRGTQHPGRRIRT